MPNGLGKTKRIAVFAQPERHKEALAAGADIVGCEDLIEQVKAGRDDFDVCIVSPDMMPKLGVLGKILGTKVKCQIQNLVLYQLIYRLQFNKLKRYG